MLTATPRHTPCPTGCTGVHSYTATGFRWCWPGADPSRNAIDAEDIAGPFPARLRRELGAADPWRVWTALEVEAKLTDVPVLVLLRRRLAGAPAAPGIRLRYEHHGDTMICKGSRD